MYILLMRSNTILSKLIHLVTGAEYTHVAIGVTPETLYTMTRKDMRFLFPAGLYLEHPYSHLPHVLLHLPVTTEVHERARTTLLWMYSNRSSYKFNILGLMLNLFGISKGRGGKYFCSEFCSMILRTSGAYSFQKPDHLVRPMDFLNIPDCKGVDSSDGNPYR